VPGEDTTKLILEPVPLPDSVRRILIDRDMTSTFKLRKIDLQREGYSPELLDDPLFIKDDQAGCYVPFSSEALARAGLPAFAGEA